MRITPYGRTPSARSLPPMTQALRTISTKRARCAASPIAEPPPTGGHTGATMEPITRSFARTLSASAFSSSSDASMLVCGSAAKMSMPSNFWPFTSAAAVSSSIVSRLIGGSDSGPLPTRPGHIALCRRGKLLAAGIGRILCVGLGCRQ